MYNFTVYESVTRRGYCYIWGESDGRRGAAEIATCLYNWLLEVDKRNDGTTSVILYCDCCAGQNRNRTVLSMLKYALTKTVNITEITLKFLLPGHTYMPADSIHATIERFVAKSAVWAPSEWSSLVRFARSNPEPYNVITMSHVMFKDWSNVEQNFIPKQLKDDKQTNIKWQSVRLIHLQRGCEYVTVKYSLREDAASMCVPLRTQRSRHSLKHEVSLQSLYASRLAISQPKYNDLKRLCTTGVIPLNYHHEYINLPVDSAITVDCLPETDAEDDQDQDAV